MMNTIINALLAAILVPLAGGLLTGADRIITARMQRRKGPPLLQPFYDVAKLLGKDSPTAHINIRFYVTFSLFFVAFAVILLFTGQDLLLCVFSFTLGCIFFVIAGYASCSPFSVVGAERELVQIMCYEPMLFLAAFGFYKATGSFHATDAFAMGKPIILKLPLIFIGLTYILTIKLRKSPFDLSTSHHGHQEIVKGITTELSGSCLAMVEIKHWFEIGFTMALVYLFFVFANPLSHILAIAACLVVYFLEIVIDNTFARLKWKATLLTSWIATGVASLCNFILLGIV